MNSPLVSIIIPVYNVEPYLRTCLESVKSQSFTDWECILIDDGSLDKSGSICDEYSLADNRFRVFHKKNGGVSTTRNVGIQKSKGDWVFFLDADDYIRPTYLKKITEDIIDADIVISGFERKGVKNDIISFKSYGRFSIESIGRILEDKYTCYPFWYCWGRMYRRATLLNNNILFNSELYYHEDTDFLFRYFLFVENMVICKDAGIIHICETQRSLKYSMSYKDLRFHVDSLSLSFNSVERKFKCNLKSVKYSLYNRMLKNFIIRAFSIDEMRYFRNELRSFTQDKFIFNMLTSSSASIIKVKVHSSLYFLLKWFTRVMPWMLFLCRRSVLNLLIKKSY